MVAAFHGHTEIVRMILERAPNTPVDDVDDAHGATALLAAAQYHHADILRLLAARGADVNFTDGRSTPLRVAVLQVRDPDLQRPRDPDPGGARQVATVRALLLLGAGTLRLAPLARRHPF